MSIIGDNIKFYRKQESLTQDQLAQHLKLDRTTITKYETGEHEPSIPCLIAMADLFDITVDELIGREKK